MSTGSKKEILPGRELADAAPAVDVSEAEYRRLLGYPPHHVPGERADELAAAARRWFAEHGRPWVYLREAEVTLADDGVLHIGGAAFQSPQLHAHLRQLGARRVMLIAVSAGPECENEARQRWEAAKPDEYFFLEMFGSAVVEQLVAATNGRVCDLAERAGLMAVPHYSPGYAGWDVAEQNKLFALIAGSATRPLPGPLEVLSSGMLRPKKSLLAVIGLAPAVARAPGAAPAVPCEGCAFSPCQYRRRPYRHAARAAVAEPRALGGSQPETPNAEIPTAAPRAAAYTVGTRALRKWAGERVRIERRDDGLAEARFRFDGTTCSNSGHPLAFDYVVTLSAPTADGRVLRTECQPAPDDDGFKKMCAYLSDPAALMAAIAEEHPPVVGRSLDAVFAWERAAAPSGCHCAAASRAHKWGLALEAIHYALAHPETSISS
jgi:hypothetical protein